MAEFPDVKKEQLRSGTTRYRVKRKRAKTQASS